MAFIVLSTICHNCQKSVSSSAVVLRPVCRIRHNGLTFLFEIVFSSTAKSFETLSKASC